MRLAFINTLIDIASGRDDIFLLTGDLGFSILERFRDKFPDRFINMGVAEANMMGVAAGLAMSCKTVVAYSITPFAVFRPFEQTRIDICYQDLNVKIIGVGSGYDYGTAGSTHHAIEDMAVMRALPGMTVLSPCDVHEVAACVEYALSRPGPFYIRISKDKNLQVHKGHVSLEEGRCIEIQPGKDAAIIATGAMVSRAEKLITLLRAAGIDSALYSLPFIKPIDKRQIIDIAASFKALFTLEDHSITGGLGSAIAEILAEKGNGVSFKRFGLPDEFPHLVGSTDYLADEAGISMEKVKDEIMRIMM